MKAARAVRAVRRVLLNTVLGFIALFFYNALGGLLGLSVGLNWVNTGLIALLGVPGFATVLLLQLMA